MEKLEEQLKFQEEQAKEEVEKAALEIENVKKHMEGKTLMKVIVVPEKIVNIVVK